MKKAMTFYALLVTVLMLFCFPALRMEAASSGDTVDYQVVLTGTYHGKAAGFLLNYDSNVLELVSGEWTVPGALLAAVDPSTGAAAMAVQTETDYTGAVAVVHFRVKANAPLGSTVISATSRDMDGVGIAPMTVTVTCHHTFSAWAKADDNNHTRTCSVCNTVETAAHNWETASVTAADCAKTGTRTLRCKECGLEKTEVLSKTSEHKWSNWSQDANNHTRTCSVCGQKETASHTYSGWQANATSHYHVCTICGYVKDNAAHTPGPAATETTAQTCTVCAYVIAPAKGEPETKASESEEESRAGENETDAATSESESTDSGEAPLEDETGNASEGSESSEEETLDVTENGQGASDTDKSHFGNDGNASGASQLLLILGGIGLFGAGALSGSLVTAKVKKKK